MPEVISKEMEYLSESVKPSRGPSLNTISWVCFAMVLLIGFADISGDYPAFWGYEYRSLIPELREYTKIVSTVLVGIIAILGLYNLVTRRSTFRASMEVKLFLGLLTLSTLWGAGMGFLTGVEPRDVLGDSQYLVVYLSVFALRGIDTRKVRWLINLLWISVSILALKLFLSVTSNMLLGISIGGRYLLKMSSFFIVMFFVSLSLFLYSTNAHERWKQFILSFIAALGLLIAQMRGYLYGTFAGLLLLAVFSAGGKRSLRLVITVVVILFLGAACGIFLQNDFSDILGHWSGENFRTGMEYRGQQLQFFLSVFRKDWLLGAGLGWFDPTSEFYPVWTSRPYVVELEYPNLLAKLGVIGFGFLMSAFGFFLLACIRASSRASTMEQRGIMTGWTCGFIALVLASATNPLYSSIYFHLYVVIILLSLSAVRMQWSLVKSAGGIS